MPGVLKLASSIYTTKPYNKFLRTVTPSTTTTSAAAAATPTSLIKNQFGWWWRITPCAPLAHNRTPFPSSFRKEPQPLHLNQLPGFCGHKFSYSSSQEKGSSVCNTSASNHTGLVTPMGPSPDKKDDQWLDDNDRHHHPHGDKEPPSPPQSDKLLTLPTILTIGRVAAVPLLVYTFYVDSWWGPNVTTGIFVAAAITDWLDGYLARKMKLGTTFGAFLDPVADKLMVAATLVLLCTKPLEASLFGQLPWLLTVPSIAIIGREITMSAVREWAASQGSKLSEAVAVNNLGKWKTATQMTSLTILLAARDSSLVGAGGLVASGVLLLYISAWLAVWSLFVYMRKIWKVLMM